MVQESKVLEEIGFIAPTDEEKEEMRLAMEKFAELTNVSYMLVPYVYMHALTDWIADLHDQLGIDLDAEVMDSKLGDSVKDVMGEKYLN